MVNAMDNQEIFDPSQTFSTFAWRADLERLRREVNTARAQGVSDPFCLAELQCSLDLIDADILGLRALHKPNDLAEHSLVKLRAQFIELIEEVEASECEPVHHKIDDHPGMLPTQLPPDD